MTDRKELRLHQVSMLDSVRDALRSGVRRIMVAAPTGSGKTICAANIIRSAREKGKRVLFTVPALSLVDQSVAVFNAEGIHDIGVIQAMHEMTDWSQPVQVASVQTLQRREKFPEADIVLIDEAHVHFKLYERLILGADRRHIPTIGLSATPGTKGLGKYYEQLIVATTTQELIDLGLLAPFRVFAPSHPDLQGVRSVGGDYVEGELAERMNTQKLVADIIETWMKLGQGRPTICFAVNRIHAQTIAERFEQAGVATGYMDCNTPVSERNAIRAKFLAGEIKIVCNVDVIGLGVDWPEISCVIYARPTRSRMRFVQHIGRSLRALPGKDALILDHSDTHLRLGFVTDIQFDELDDGKPKPPAAEKNPALPKECPACAFLKPPRTAVCPNCGHVSKAICQVETAPGELAELKPKRSAIASVFTDKSSTYRQLKAYGIDRGYAHGWASNKYREIYGVWPKLVDGPPQRPSRELVVWIKAERDKWRDSQRKMRDEIYLARVSSMANVRASEPAPPPITVVPPPGDSPLMTERDWEEFR